MTKMEILVLRKCCRKYLMLILSVLLTLSIIRIPTKVDAATPYKLINLWDKKATVGGVKFSSKRENDTGKVTIYYKINNKTKVLVSGEGLGTTVLTNGRWVYYVATNDVSYNFYKQDLRNGRKTKIFSEKSPDMSVELSGFYKNKLYYVNGIDPGTLCYFDLKSRKKKKVMNNVTLAEQYGSIFLCTPYEGDVGASSLRFYDAKSNSKKTITKNKMGYRVISKKLYYVEYIRAYDSNQEYMDPEDYICNVVRCDLTGKNKKVLLKDKRINGYVSKITSSYIQYTNYDFDNDTSKVYTLKYK